MPALRLTPIRVCGVFLIIAVVFGGGGSPSPVSEFVVLLAAIVCIVTLMMIGCGNPRWSRGGIAVAAAVVALPALQLIPLPPAWWAALPGREGASALAGLTGSTEPWRPLSLFPEMTVASLLSLLPAFAAAMAISAVPVGRRWNVLVLIAALALVTTIVGFVQFIGGDRYLRFHSYTHFDFATGFFASRNATADLIAIGLLALAAIARSAPREVRSPAAMGGWAAAVLILVLGMLATGSRAGLVLLVIPALAMVRALRPPATGFRGLPSLVLGLLVLAGIGIAALQFTSLVATRDRFALADVTRPALWTDTRFAIGQHWPLGAGFGTFVPVYAAVEQLDNVGETYANRAHNDYLEIALEGGAPALVLLGLIAAYLLNRARLLIAGADRDAREQAFFAVASLSVFALHASVDYPLRTLTLMTFAGLFFGLLVGGSSLPRAGLRQERAESARRDANASGRLVSGVVA